MASGENWWEHPDQPDIPNPNDNTNWSPTDPYNQAPQPPANQTQGGGNGCGPGLFPTSLDEEGTYTAGQSWCLPEDEVRRRASLPGKVTQTWPGPTSTTSKGGGGAPPPTKWDPGPVPQFHAPQFTFDEKFSYPTFEEALKEPGYQFGLQQGLGAIQNSAAAKGVLRGGGTLKGLNDYAQNFAAQNYGNVANRALQGYNTRRDTAQQAWEDQFRGAQAEYAPNLIGWQTNAQLGDNSLDRLARMYYFNNLSAADILAALSGLGLG